MRKRVLIVEDNPEIAALLATGLEEEFDTAVVGDAPAALQCLAAFRPDVVLLDVILARGTGLQVLEHVASAGDETVPVIVMTGYAQDMDLAPFARVVAGVMTKPFSLDEVAHRVNKAIDQGGVPWPKPVVHQTDRGTVLLVEDDDILREGLVQSLDGAGYRAVGVGTPGDACSLLSNQRFDALITDWILPGATGLEVLQHARNVSPLIPVIVLTGYATPEFTRRALSLGAADVLPKPFPSRALPLVLEKCIQQSRLGSGTNADPVRVPERHTTRRPEESTGLRYTIDDIIGSSRPIERARQLLRQIAPLDSTVLLRGETGTGKELFAQALHVASRRSGGPFVAVNVAAIPESLMESELFGYSGGAFTGAKREGHTGKLLAANGGTFFMDEIGDLPPALQAKLLRILQEGEVTPIGGAPRRVDVRFVSATHRDLAAMVEDGAFRHDLYYRLNVLELTLPPLRERQEDIGELAERFLFELRQRYGGEEKRFAGETLARLQAYQWPGNIRELHNVVEHAHAFASGDLVLPVHLPSHLAEPVHEQGEGSTTPNEDERQRILDALAHTGGNKVKAAKLLGISRAGLYVKLKVLRIT